MFYQIIFVILLCGEIILTTRSDIRLYYHLFYKHDYLEWSAEKGNDSQDLQALMGAQRFRLLYTISFGLVIFGIIFLHFALFWLSKSFESPRLTHVAATSLLLTILGNFMTLFIYPIPGVTNIKLETPKIISDVIVTFANYCCLVYMAIQMIKWYLY